MGGWSDLLEPAADGAAASSHLVDAALSFPVLRPKSSSVGWSFFDPMHPVVQKIIWFFIWLTADCDLYNLSLGLKPRKCRSFGKHRKLLILKLETFFFFLR